MAHGRHGPADVICSDPPKWVHVTNEAEEGNCPGPPDQEGVSDSAPWCDFPGTAPLRASGGETLYSDPAGGQFVRGGWSVDVTGLTAKGSVHVETGSVSAAPALGPLVPLHCPPCAQGRAGHGLPELVCVILDAGSSRVGLTSTSSRPRGLSLPTVESWASSSPSVAESRLRGAPFLGKPAQT